MSDFREGYVAALRWVLEELAKSREGDSLEPDEVRREIDRMVRGRT